jgi:hypothetical protein
MWHKGSWGFKDPIAWRIRVAAPALAEARARWSPIREENPPAAVLTAKFALCATINV